MGKASKDKKEPEGTVPIPYATGPWPILGILTEIDPKSPTASLDRLADKYGEIYRFQVPGGESAVVVSTQALVNELCDETRFKKKITNVLREIRTAVRDALFTAEPSIEPSWGIAHRILLPAFGPIAIKGMFDEMHDIANQLVLKWARHGPSYKITVTEDFTRLTLDTIALCAMGYRFNLFYHDSMHEMIDAMTSFLIACGDRTRRILPAIFYRKQDKTFLHDIEVLRRTSDEVLAARKANPTEKKDLLSAMLHGVDSKTGQKMSDQNITDSLVTFLIAGHETTSGLLSFAFCNMLKNPSTYRKAQQEVDEVIGRGPVKVEHMVKLPYLNAVLRETLRVTASIPLIAITALKDEIIGGKYKVDGGETILLLLSKSQRDPAIFGDDGNNFRPERMLDENFEKLDREYPNFWKPFGNGMRACIGRAFAWQEALLTMALLLQNFNFVLHDPSYELRIKETLTMKPQDLYMRAILRHDMTATQLEQNLRVGGSSSSTTATSPPQANGVKTNGAMTNGKSAKKGGKRVSIFYGSNSGTCEALAQRLAADAASQGFHTEEIDVLDAANQKLPTDHPVILITASYEGEPPDNAAHFVAWLESLKAEEGQTADASTAAKASYAVFGCGHHDWIRTFHRIPKLIDSKLAELGATRLAPLGLTDVADSDAFVDFETWEFEHLWPALAAQYGGGDDTNTNGHAPEAAAAVAASSIVAQITTPRSASLRQDVKEAVVISAKQLTAPGHPVKKHMEIQLSTTGTDGSLQKYSVGDYLAVLPLNPKPSVERAMRRFGLAWDAHITITSSGVTTLPTGSPVSVYDVLSSYVELAQPATKRGVLALAEAAAQSSNDKDNNDAHQKAEAATAHAQLQELATGTAYQTEIGAHRVSVLDILERFPSINLPFGTFLALLPPMRVRQYSISSSPVWNPGRVTLTYSILDAPSLSRQFQEGRQGCRHLGVASSYLASLEPEDHLHVSVRPSHTSFRLPADPERTPLICIAAGSGLAPFRGFAQERAAQFGAGRKLAPMLLFFGCREPDADDLYREELDKWEKLGALAVRRAHSRRPEASAGCRYVQHRLWHDRAEVSKLWDSGAKVFVCGSREVADGVKEVVFQIAKEAHTGNGDAGKTSTPPAKEDVQKWYEDIRHERYATDVFD